MANYAYVFNPARNFCPTARIGPGGASTLPLDPRAFHHRPRRREVRRIAFSLLFGEHRDPSFMHRTPGTEPVFHATGPAPEFLDQKARLRTAERRWLGFVRRCCIGQGDGYETGSTQVAPVREAETVRPFAGFKLFGIRNHEPVGVPRLADHRQRRLRTASAKGDEREDGPEAGDPARRWTAIAVVHKCRGLFQRSLRFPRMPAIRTVLSGSIVRLAGRGRSV